MEIVAKIIVVVVGVVEAGAVKVVGGVQVQGGKPSFFGLLLPRPEPHDPRLAINNLYNICINQ